MQNGIGYYELRCSVCDWLQLCGPGMMRDWLRKVGKIRATSDMDSAILVELFCSCASQYVCPECGQHGLHVAAETDEDWPQAVSCEVCSKPIPAERLAAIPGTTLCAVCQEKEEQGVDTTQPEYCPSCGALMIVRPSSSGGITRYVASCTGNPPCRPGRRG